MAGRLGDILVDRGYITQEQLETALSQRGMLGANLLNQGLVTTDQLGEALATQFGVPYHEVVPTSVNPQLVRLLPESFARDRLAVPVEVSDRELRLAMVAPDDIETISEVELITGYQVEPVVAMQPEVQETLDRGFDERTVARQTVVDVKMAELLEADEHDDNEIDAEEINPDSDDKDSPVVVLVRSVLMGAYNAGASDIHLEPHEPEMRVRYRVDGKLQEVMTIPEHIEPAVVARIKVRADMDTTETRRPQDGTMSIETDENKVNFRVSCIPTTGGEKMCLRLLDEGNKVFDLNSISLTDRDLKRVNTMIDKPHGMVLITGPTGSGKSTTMYAMLSKLNSPDKNISTVEDPVEYKIKGINQVQSDNEFGMGFATALKFLMRQDPDIILVGEIRDHETATTSVQAALTGHLLISTLHTNEAVGVVARLSDLGVDPFKIGGSLIGAIAQRLVRRVCKHCSEPHTPTDAMIEAMTERGHVFPKDAVFHQGRGCKKCLGTGYAGRLPIFEVMVVTEELAKGIECGLPSTKLEEIAQEDGMFTLAQAGFEQALAGNTTLEEIYYKT